MVADTDGFDEDIAEMRESVAVDLSQWIEELSAVAGAGALTSPASHETQRAVLFEMRLLAHKIGGTAGTFGFAEVGAPALTLEKRCIEALAAGTPAAPAALEEIGGLLTAIERAGRQTLGP